MGYASSDGKVHLTLQDAQRAEIVNLGLSNSTMGEDESKGVAQFILENATKLLDILTTTSKSKPRARAVNGGKKVRKPKTSEPSMFKEQSTQPAA